ncbi:hypothetical protein [Streptomyces fradiae]|uniref:hypothetical protein n=1 Tax=Streptomyces fradiae TaxID=1906 RepID=UPI0039859DAE
MDLPSEIVLLFDRDADLLVFESFARATGWVEAIDVDEGEYTAAYSADGAVLALTAPEGPDGPVALVRTGLVDPGDLERRVARYWRCHQTGQHPRDPVETARYLIERDSRLRGSWSGRLTGMLRRGGEPLP